MCGIAGILNFNNRPVSKEEINNCVTAIEHRGRDSFGIVLGGQDRGVLSGYNGIALGHRRLSIIDLSVQSAQPMFNDDNNLCITYNGELYNYLEIKSRLRAEGHTFHTESDTEVVLHAYQQWGEACLSQFNGMFAFAIWNEKDRSLFCARDPIGIKPFYYTLNSTSFRFASESRALVTGTKNELDNDAVISYLLSMYVPRKQSIFKDVQKLLPGCYIKLYTDGRIEEKQYWKMSVNQKLRTSEAEAAEELQALIDRSVHSQLRSDVPVGTLLSGGFDSGMLVASAARFQKGLHTYSVGFDDGIQFNELSIAWALSKRYGTTHHERTIKSDEVIQYLDKAISCMSEPIADSAIVPTYCLSQMAAEDGVKVLLSGTGGDEIFAGYQRYVGYNRARLAFMLLPRTVRNALGGIFANKALGARLRYPSIDMLVNTGGSQELASSLFSTEAEFRQFLNNFAVSILPLPEPGLPLLHEHMQFDIQVYLPDLLLMLLDQLTMAHTVEGRVPYLDVDLITASFSYDPKVHATLKKTRLLQRKMAIGQVDDRTLTAQKQGFSGPVTHWINNNTAVFKEKAMAVKDIPGLQHIDAESLFDKSKNNGSYKHYDIFALYCLSSWYHNRR